MLVGSAGAGGEEENMRVFEIEIGLCEEGDRLIGGVLSYLSCAFADKSLYSD